MEPILHGLILAFGLILPLGVQNIFVFTQGAVQPRRRQALPAVITAALCDTLLITVAVLGLSVIVNTLGWLRVTLMVGGIVFLCYMGWVMWRSKPVVQEQAGGMQVKQQIIFAMSVSLLNPHAILDTVGVIGTSALKYHGIEQWMFTATCIFFSWIWFTSLMFVGSFMKQLDSSGRMLWIMNKCSAIFIWGTAIWLLLS